MKIIQEDRGVSAASMKIGQCAKALEPPYEGDVILRHFSGWVDLNNPVKTWSDDCNLEVKIIPVGERIVLEMDK